MKRFLIIVLSIVLISSLGLFNLSAKGQSEEDGQVTLKWWHHMPLDGAQGKLFIEYIKEFEAANPGIKIEMDSIPHTEYLKKLPTAIASGQAPDLFGLSYRMLHTYGANQSMSPIDNEALTAMGLGSNKELMEAWTDGVLEAYKYDDSFFGLPFQFNIYSYIINKKHFIEAGLNPETDYPKTWDDVFAVAEKLVVKDGNKIRRQALSFPFSHSAAWYLLELEPILRDLGGSVLNEDQSECLLNSNEAIEAMEIIKKRFDLNVSDSAIALGLDYYNTGFPSAEFSMTVGGQWGPARWYKNFADTTDGDEFMAIPYPTVNGGNPPISTTSWAWVVSRESKNKEAAWKFIDFITSMPSRNLIETGDTIPRAGWSTTEGAKSIPQSEFWEEMLQYSQPLANYIQYSEVSELIKVAMQEILISNEDIRETLDDLKKEIDFILQD